MRSRGFRFVLFLIVVQISVRTISLKTPTSTLILVDPFTEYLTGHCKEYCKEHGIRVVEVVSSYSNGALEAKGMALPPSFLAPKDGEEVEWAEAQEIDLESCCVLAESDAGVPTAERIASNLDLRGNGISPHFRNKYLTNERARASGIEVVQQVLATTWEEAEGFLTQLWAGAAETVCIVKPYRGVASDGVNLCRSMQEAKESFLSLHLQPQFGGGVNEAVLIQEFLVGQEYAVDTVSKDGEIKVLALWKYRKVPMNGAPFVYECTELVSSGLEETTAVCDYCVEVLKALGVNWGPTHTEIMATSEGPRLIEVNARFHAANTYPLARVCLGYDALTATMDCYFNPDSFDCLPDRPENILSHGVIMHLISKQKGTVIKVNHLDEINEMESVQKLEIESKVGDDIIVTVNIRTDSGYVLLENTDPEGMQRDYSRILELQETMFEVEEVEEGGEVQGVEGVEEGVEKEEQVEVEEVVEEIVDAVLDSDVEVVEEEVKENDGGRVVSRAGRRRRSNQVIDDSSAIQQERAEATVYSQPSGQLQDAMKKYFSQLDTTQILNILRQKGTRASVFLLGGCVAAYSVALSLPLFYSA